MFVHLRETGGKVVYDMIDRVRKRHIYQGTIRKDARYFLPEGLVQAVVVVHVQEAAAIQVFSKSDNLGVREL
jgi:hypothetical protein